MKIQITRVRRCESGGYTEYRVAPGSQVERIQGVELDAESVRVLLEERTLGRVEAVSPVGAACLAWAWREPFRKMIRMTVSAAVLLTVVVAWPGGTAAEGPPPEDLQSDVMIVSAILEAHGSAPGSETWGATCELLDELDEDRVYLAIDRASLRFGRKPADVASIYERIYP